MTKLGIGDKSPEFRWQTDALQLTRDLLGGTDVMRDKGGAYLPQRAAEDDASYRARLKGAVLVNQYERTGGYFVGQVFQKPLRYQEMKKKLPQEEEVFWEAFYENSDNQNTNLSVFGSKAFRRGIDDGVVFILADYSDVGVERGPDGGLYYWDTDGNLTPKNAEADRKNGWRPYLVLVKADQVLECRLATENGVSKLVYFRYMEATSRDIDGEWRTVSRVREFWPDRWILWEQESEKSAYREIAQGALTNEAGRPLGCVPVVWFVPGKGQDNGYTAQPAMKDLAHLNVEHWQAKADHKQLMQWMRSPVWFGRKLRNSDGGPVSFGVGRLVSVDDDGASLESVGVDPQSVEKSFQDLKKIEDDMALYGLQMLTASSQNMTATQADIAESASNSQLKEWVQKFSDVMENALALIAAWKGYADGRAVSINTEFRIAFNSGIVSLLANMVNNGQLSKGTLLETLKLMGVFADEFNVDEELTRIAAAQAANETYSPDFGQYAGRENLQQ